MIEEGRIVHQKRELPNILWELGGASLKSMGSKDTAGLWVVLRALSRQFFLILGIPMRSEEQWFLKNGAGHQAELDDET